MTPRWMAAACICTALAQPVASHAFCGFYVAGGDAKLYNQASQVVLVRDGDRTVITMANDFRGEPREFAIVVPVPTVLEEGQIHIGDQKIIDHLDAFTAPRLVEYFDENPCQLAVREELAVRMGAAQDAAAPSAKRARNLGVQIEATYTVGEYDIVILSAKESGGLETWLIESGYRIPVGASRVLRSYIRNGMKFFVAKVNLEKQASLGFTNLRPITIAYESARFMLPIRLGMVNADGPQDLLVYAITREGRVEATNYRTIKLPSDVEIPSYIGSEFADFYRAMFDHQVKSQGMRTVFTEYAWDMSWCDPCASDPLSRNELRQLGVFWLDGGQQRGAAQNAFVTRLHVRYDAAHFPEDLQLQVTQDRSNFQGRFVMRHFWQGDASCPAAKQYRATLPDRRREQAEALADLTGWKLEAIRQHMALDGDWSTPGESVSWWQRIWSN